MGLLKRLFGEKERQKKEQKVEATARAAGGESASEPWLILTSRYGADTDAPSREDLRKAVGELYDEDHRDLTEADYEEHGSASLRHGYDDGPMLVLEIGRHGKVTLEEWADQDYDTPLAPTRTIENVSREKALELWLLLAAGEIGSVREQFPEETP